MKREYTAGTLRNEAQIQATAVHLPRYENTEVIQCIRGFLANLSDKESEKIELVMAKHTPAGSAEV